MLLKITKGLAIGDQPLGKAMFGGNILFDVGRLDGSCAAVVPLLGVTGLRYPGGAVSERRDPHTGEFAFDVTNPDAAYVPHPVTDEFGNEVPGTEIVIPISKFIAYSNANNLAMSFVIPTSETYGQNYKTVYGDPTWSPPETNGVVDPLFSIQWDRYNDVLQYARDLIDGNYGDISGATLEIGNEFYAVQDTSYLTETQASYPLPYTTFTASVYGIVASKMAKEISDYALAAGIRDEIEIHVQAGKTEFGDIKSSESKRNSLVLAEFDEDELAAVDGIVSHFYPRDEMALNPNDPDGNGTHNVSRAHYVDAWSAAAGRELTSNISEWNVASPTGVDGLHQVEVLAQFLEFFQKNGVDQASVWPIQQNNQSDLSGYEGSTELTLAGEFFQMAAHSLIGKTLYVSEDLTPDVTTYYYSDADDNITLVLVNATEVAFAQSLDLTGLAAAGDRIAVSTLKAYNSNLQTPAYLDPAAEAHLSVASYDGSDGTIALDFMERGVIFVSIAKTVGFNLHSDLLIGSHSGATGADIFTGSQFADLINLGKGDDILSGGEGNDTLIGACGDDTMSGGNSDDMLIGELGHNFLYGDSGTDLLIAGGEIDEMWGGTQEDWFVFDRDALPLASVATIADFESGVDRIVLMGGVGQKPLSMMNGAFVLNRTGSTLIVEGDTPTFDDFLFRDATPDMVDLSAPRHVAAGLLVIGQAPVFQMPPARFGHTNVTEDFEDALDVVQDTGFWFDDLI